MKNVLIIRSSAIGDIVFASPFAKAIKAKWPQARITWLVDKGCEALLEDSPFVDDCVIMPSGQWRQLWKNGKKLEAIRQIRTFGQKLKGHHFDVAIDLQGLFKSGIFAWMSGAPKRLGLGSREGSQYLMSQVFPRGGDISVISSEYSFLADQLGLETTDFIPTLSVNKDAENTVLQRLADAGLSPGQYIVFAAFTTRAQKHWFVDAWQALAPMIKKRTGLTPLLLGGPADTEAATALTVGEIGRAHV